jgi:hypothetical protein
VQSTVRLCVLIATVVIAAVAAVSIKQLVFNYLLSAAEAASQGDESAGEFFAYITGGTDAAQMLNEVGETALVPFIFFGIFIVLNLITLIIYAIISACALSEKHKMKKCDKNNEKYVKPGALSRIGSLIFNFAISFSIVSLLLLPLTYGIPLAYNAVKVVEAQSAVESAQVYYDDDYLSSDEQEYALASIEFTSSDDESSGDSSEGSSTIETVKAIYKSVKYSTLFEVYSPLDNFIADNMTGLTSGNDKTTVTEFFDKFADVLVDAIKFESGELSTNDLYNLANTVSGNGYLDKLLGGLISDACTSWGEGEPFLGVEPFDGIPTSVYKVVAEQDNASEILKALGHSYAVMSIVSPSEGSTATPSQLLNSLSDNLTPDSVSIIKDVVDDVIGKQLPDNEQVAGALSSVVTNMLDGLLDVKTNGTEEELKTETESIAKVFEIAEKADQGLKDDDISDLINAVNDSQVIKDSLQQVAEEESNVLDVEISEDTANAVYKALEDNGISKDSDTYKIVESILGMYSADGGKDGGVTDGDKGGESANIVDGANGTGNADNAGNTDNADNANNADNADNTDNSDNVGNSDNVDDADVVDNGTDDKTDDNDGKDKE